MKKTFQLLLMGSVIAVFSLSVNALESLRGGNELAKSGQTFDKWDAVTQEGGFEKNFEEQPPLISHTIDDDEITLKNNSCMRCHSKENHKKEDSPMVSESHFVDRDGNELSELSSRRYFCNQCHIPQTNTEPLIDNNY